MNPKLFKHFDLKENTKEYEGEEMQTKRQDRFRTQKKNTKKYI